MNNRIWYVSKYAMSPTFGDPTRQFLFSKYFVKSGKDVTLIGSQSNLLFKKRKASVWEDQSSIDDGVKSIFIRGAKISLGFNFKRILSWILFEFRFLIFAFRNKNQKPDVLIVSSLSVLTFLSGIILKKVWKCKLICEVRDIYPLTLIATKGWSTKNPFIYVLSILEKLAYKYSDKIVGSMPNLVEHVANVSPSNQHKVAFIPMGVDLSLYEKEIANEDFFSNEFDSLKSQQSFIVGYAGSIGFVNCVEEIIKAANLLKEYPIKFAILGNGPLKAQIEKSVQDNGLKNVCFFKNVEKKYVHSFLEKCDILINPWKDYNKLYKYGVSPNKWIDYMHSGKPIIVSLNGFHHIINEARCGEFIEANNVESLASTVIKYSKKDKATLKEIGENGKSYLINELNYPKLTQKYLEIIKSL